jgi:hypothetical protein
VARTTTVAGNGTAEGAVYSPLEAMVPTAELPPAKPFTDQATAVLKLPVPRTLAEHCEVLLTWTDAEAQATDTEVIVGGGGVMAMFAVPDFVWSATLVALTTTVAGEGTADGAV